MLGYLKKALRNKGTRFGNKETNLKTQYESEIKYSHSRITRPEIKKIVSVTPAGRKRYLEILIPYLLQQQDYLNSHIFWLNTTDSNDIKYIKEQCEKHPNFFSFVESEVQIDGNKSISHFFKNCQDEDTIYIRFDDDICFVEKAAVENIIKFRLSNPYYFLILGNIVNNSICSHLHQRLGSLPLSIGNIKYDCLCEIGWNTPKVAANIHKKFIESLKNNDLHRYKFDKWVLKEYERFSINFISWFGADFKEFNGNVGEMSDGATQIEEEVWLTEYYPKVIGRPNCICGNALVSHFAFFTQRNFIESETNILNEYKSISKSI